MSDHSPGPWQIICSSYYTGEPEDTTILHIQAADDTTVLFTDSGYWKPREADAQFIAAAPARYQRLVNARRLLLQQDYEGALREIDLGLDGIYQESHHAQP